MKENCADRAHINSRWEAFFREKIGILRLYASGDDELVDIGLMSVGNLLDKHPDCPISWLVQRAKYDIKNEQIRRFKEVGTDYGNPDRFDHESTKRWEEKLQYEAMSGWAKNPETIVIDKLQYEAMLASLTSYENKLLEIMREEAVLSPNWGRRWYGVYPKNGRERPTHKKRFTQEVSRRVKDYTIAFAGLRFKFYQHFGSDDEIAREQDWYDTFDPFGRLHVNRNSHYDRNPGGNSL